MTRKEVPRGTSFTFYMPIKNYNSTHKTRKFVRVFLQSMFFCAIQYNLLLKIQNEIRKAPQ